MPEFQGEPEEVWRAIYDHYKPLSMEGEIPATEAGRIVSLADKWDTLTSCFTVGLMPTGSRDPFALRRAAQGVVRIVVEGKVKFDFPDMNDALREFMRDRIEYYFRDVRGFRLRRSARLHGRRLERSSRSRKPPDASPSHPPDARF